MVNPYVGQLRVGRGKTVGKVIFHLKIVGRGRREPVGGEDGVKVC